MLQFSLVFLVINLLWNIFLFAKKDLLPAAILSFISSPMKLSAFIIVPRYLAEFTSSIFIQPLKLPFTYNILKLVYTLRLFLFKMQFVS